MCLGVLAACLCGLPNWREIFCRCERSGQTMRQPSKAAIIGTVATQRWVLLGSSDSRTSRTPRESFARGARSEPPAASPTPPRPPTESVRVFRLSCQEAATGHGLLMAVMDSYNGERLSAAAQRWLGAPTLPRQISVDGPNRRSCDGVRGCWAM